MVMDSILILNFFFFLFDCRQPLNIISSYSVDAIEKFEYRQVVAEENDVALPNLQENNRCHNL
jgi:hypothetical protein